MPGSGGLADYVSPTVRLALLREDYPEARVAFDVCAPADAGLDARFLEGDVRADMVVRCTVTVPGQETVVGWKEVPAHEYHEDSAGTKRVEVKLTPKLLVKLQTQALGRAMKRLGYPDKKADLVPVVNWRASVRGIAPQAQIGPEPMPALPSPGLSQSRQGQVRWNQAPPIEDSLRQLGTDVKQLRQMQDAMPKRDPQRLTFTENADIANRAMALPEPLRDGFMADVETRWPGGVPARMEKVADALLRSYEVKARDYGEPEDAEVIDHNDPDPDPVATAEGADIDGLRLAYDGLTAEGKAAFDETMEEHSLTWDSLTAYDVEELTDFAATQMVA